MGIDMVCIPWYAHWGHGVLANVAYLSIQKIRPFVFAAILMVSLVAMKHEDVAFFHPFAGRTPLQCPSYTCVVHIVPPLIQTWFQPF